jgi:hypothetical protein
MRKLTVNCLLNFDSQILHFLEEIVLLELLKFRCVFLGEKPLGIGFGGEKLGVVLKIC